MAGKRGIILRKYKNINWGIQECMIDFSACSLILISTCDMISVLYVRLLPFRLSVGPTSSRSVRYDSFLSDDRVHAREHNQSDAREEALSRETG